MAKASIPGRTKTRLTPPLTPEQAADLPTALLGDVADNLLAAAALASISPWMAYAPADSQDFFARILPDGVGSPRDDSNRQRRLPDPRNQLATGRRSWIRVPSELRQSDPANWKSDSGRDDATTPGAPGDRIGSGPATDGGYYLVGIKQPIPASWKTWAGARSVFCQSLARADERGLPVAVTAELARRGPPLWASECAGLEQWERAIH
jgi:uncharacterized protein